MPILTRKIEFDGYWRDIKKNSIPEISGIYCVYSAKYTKENDFLRIVKLIYIGESKDVHKRVNSHEKRKEWEACLQENEELCFSCAEVDSQNRERCEAAMIYHHKPAVNTEHKDLFSFDTTALILEGDISQLNRVFIVQSA